MLRLSYGLPSGVVKYVILAIDLRLVVLALHFMTWIVVKLVLE